MPEHIELIVYGADDATGLFAVGTDPEHDRPYLQMPEHFGAAEVDPLDGKAMISQMSVGVIDAQTGATKQDRWLAAQLGADGFSALNRRRAKLWYPGTGVVIQESVIGGVTLRESYA